MSARAARGARNHRAGLAAEDAAAAHYESLGATVLARRWRGPTLEGRRGAEIDLVARLGDTLIVAEVKAGKDATVLARITPRVWTRLETAALCYIVEAQMGETPIRFDAVLVTAAGAVEMIENAHVAESW